MMGAFIMGYGLHTTEMIELQSSILPLLTSWQRVRPVRV